MNAELIDELRALRETLLTAVPVDKRLWTADACAQYLCYSRAHFLAHIGCLPGFPRAMQIIEGPKGKRWKAVDVIEWAEGRHSRTR